MAISTGPSIKNTCRVLNQNSCGSASYCGRRGSKALFLTNAHVAGTRVGRVVKVFLESLGQTIDCRVIMAAYSDRTLADWAVLESVDDYNPPIEPVKLSKKRPKPTDSHYTKGFPRCQPHNGTDITTVDQSESTPLWRWNPDAIGGQSGSAVWSDKDNLQYGLLTWSWGGYGAGQMTSEIYKQALGQTTVGHARVDGLIEVSHEFDYSGTDIDRNTLDDPIVENGFYSQTANITDLDIWAEDSITPPPVDPEPSDLKDALAEYHREMAEVHSKWQKIFEGTTSQGGPNTNDNNLYGMG